MPPDENGGAPSPGSPGSADHQPKLIKSTSGYHAAGLYAIVPDRSVQEAHADLLADDGGVVGADS